MAKKTESSHENDEKQLTTGNNAMAIAPDYLSEEDYGGAGFEGADRDSFAIPFLQVLQKMSPLVDEDSPKYIQGAKAGMFYNTVTGKLYDGKAGVQIIPCGYKRSFIQWGARDGDGGFKGEFTPEQFAAMVENKEVTLLNGKAYVPDKDGLVNEKKSDYIADTRSHYVLAIDPDGGEIGMAVVSLAGTLTKASRTLMTLLQQKKVNTPTGKRTPPTFANVVRMTTVPMSNDKGSWSGVKFELEGMVNERQTFEDAKEFYKNINSGKIKADHSKSDPTSNGAESAGVGEGEVAEGF
jgi:hypothetical protein